MTHHTLSTVTFDVAVTSAARAEDVCEQLSRFAQRRLRPLLDECIRQSVGPGGNLVLDRLELNLGELPTDSVIDVLAERLRATLVQALSAAHFSQGSSGEREEPAASSDAEPLAALRHYIESGQSHWRGADVDAGLADLLAFALTSHRESALAIVRSAWQQPRTQRRLLWQSDADMLDRLIDAAGRDDALRFVQRLEAMHRAEALPIPPHVNFGLMVRAAVLDMLLSRAAAYGLVSPAFVADTDADVSDELAAMLPWLIRRLGVPADDFAQALAQRSAARAESSPDDAGGEIEARRDSPERDSASPQSRAGVRDMSRSRSARPTRAAFLALLDGHLQEDDLAVLGDIDGGAWLLQLLETDGANLLADLAAPGNRETRMTNLLRHCPPQALEKLVLRSSPRLGGFAMTLLLAAERVGLGLPLWRATLRRSLFESRELDGAGTWLSLVLEAALADIGTDAAAVRRRLLEGARQGALEDRRFESLVDALLVGHDAPDAAADTTPQRREDGATAATVSHEAFPPLADFMAVIGGRLHGDDLAEPGGIDIGAWLVHLLETDGDTLRAALAAPADHDEHATNLLRYCSPPAVDELILRLSSRLGGFVMTVLLAADRAGLGSPMWLASLRSLLSASDKEDDAGTWLHSTLASVSAATGFGAATLRTRLADSARDCAVDDARFELLLEILTGEAVRMADRDGQGAAMAEARRQTGENVELLAYLRYGTRPAQDSSFRLQFAQQLRTALGRRDDRVMALLEESRANLLVRRRMAGLLDRAGLSIILEERGAADVLPVLDDIARLLSSAGIEVSDRMWMRSVGWSVGATTVASSTTDQRAAGIIEQSLATLARELGVEYTEVIRVLGIQARAAAATARSAAAGLVVKMADAERHASSTQPVADASAPDLEKQAVYVDNAGLVILWPFLSTFFDRLDLLDGDRFRTPDRQRRAVHLLQYLVTGESATPEHRLILNKLLCGLDLSEPVESGTRISDDEASLAGSLLDGVRQQWPALKNSSADALQQTFLQRRGRIKRTTEQGPLVLQVEKQSVDVLLQQLPWTIAVFRLPWMREALHVSWT